MSTQRSPSSIFSSKFMHCNWNALTYSLAFFDLMKAGLPFIVTSCLEFALLAGSPRISNLMLVILLCTVYYLYVRLYGLQWMSKMGRWIVAQENNGDIRYDERRRGYTGRGCWYSPQAPERREVAGEHQQHIEDDGDRQIIFPQNK